MENTATLGETMSDTCRPSMFGRHNIDDQIVFTFTEPHPDDVDLEAVGPAGALVRDPNGHIAALFISDPSKVIPDAADASLTVALAVDPDADMAYLYLGRPGAVKVARTVELTGRSLVVDLDDEDRLIGIEFFDASNWFCPAVLTANDEPDEIG